MSKGRLWLAWHALLCGGSVALAMMLAFAHSLGALSWPPTAALDWSGWQTLCTSLGFWKSLAYSVALTVITLLLALCMALLLFATLGARLRSAWLGRALLLPLAVPPVVAALLGFSLLGDSGWLSRLAHALGWIARPADFPTLVFDPAGRGIVLCHLTMVTPLFVLLFAQLSEHLRLPVLLRLAATLGASRRQAWLRVALPLLLTQARAVIAVYGLALLGAYELPLLLGAAQPSMVSVTIQHAVAGYDLAQRPYGYAMAASYLSLLVAAWALAMLRATRPAALAR